MMGNRLIMVACIAVVVASVYSAINTPTVRNKMRQVQEACDNYRVGMDAKKKCKTLQREYNMEYLCNEQHTYCWVEVK